MKQNLNLQRQQNIRKEVNICFLSHLIVLANCKERNGFQLPS